MAKKKLHGTFEMIIWDTLSLPRSRTAEKRYNYSFQPFGLETDLSYKHVFHGFIPKMF